MHLESVATTIFIGFNDISTLCHTIRVERLTNKPKVLRKVLDKVSYSIAQRNRETNHKSFIVFYGHIFTQRLLIAYLYGGAKSIHICKSDMNLEICSIDYQYTSCIRNIIVIISNFLVRRKLNQNMFEKMAHIPNVTTE